MKFLILYLMLCLVFSAHAVEEDCEQGTPDTLSTLMEDLSKINDSMYKKVLDLKVNHDGEGHLSVFKDKQGTPQLLKLTYKSKGGTVMNKVLTFKELAEGKSLWYESDDIKGKAIVVEKAEPFATNKTFQFKVKVRSSLSPEKFLSNVVKFQADSHTILNNNKPFKTIVLSPGISFFSWDGTFKKIEFKN
jgi:hypothetical protein